MLPSPIDALNALRNEETLFGLFYFVWQQCLVIVEVSFNPADMEMWEREENEQIISFVKASLSRSFVCVCASLRVGI